MSDGALSAVRDEDTGIPVGAGASRQEIDCAVQGVVYRLSVRFPLECFENLRETGSEILCKGACAAGRLSIMSASWITVLKSDGRT